MNIALTKGRATAPLCVDLDGTLVRSDLLHEAVFLLLRLNIFYLFVLPLWLLKGKAHFKAMIAERVMPDVDTVPYNQAVLDEIGTAREEGRPVLLVTASPARWAKAIADHLGLFDGVEASDGKTNLSSSTKARRLVDLFGQNGFDYIGNGRADVAVWDKARTAIVVPGERGANRYARTNTTAQTLDGQSTPSRRLKAWFKAIRIHQWLKNTLLFVSAILGARLLEVSSIWSLSIAFLSFSLCASSVYLLNDLLDIPVDRKHATKKSRPVAAGVLQVRETAVTSVLLLATAFALAATLPLKFMAVLVLYYATTCAYSFYIKRLLLIDVLTLAGLFTIRVLAGSAAIEGMISTWLLAFCMFFFLSLALVKRFVELNRQSGEAGWKTTGRSYHRSDLEPLSQGGMASGFAAVVVLALFIDSPQVVENYRHPEAIWLVCPLVLYIIMRIWILARRGEMHDDPVVFMMTDWRSQIMIAAGAAIMILSQVV
ncbi:MAG: UbiA family prenyltransferase [Pseudomonadota bacterium]